MPNYEYSCKGCDNTFTEMSRVDDGEAPCKKPCSECGEEVHLLISKTNFILKGKGWYKDGY